MIQVRKSEFLVYASAQNADFRNQRPRGRAISRRAEITSNFRHEIRRCVRRDRQDIANHAVDPEP